MLLTGATGFLGSHLVEALTGRGLEVVCLVRAAGDDAASARLAAALGRFAVPCRRAHGVAARAGDLAAPDLGIDAERRALLGSELDAVVHAGALVSWLAPYDALRLPNVLGTHALLAFAAAHGLPFHHVSTISTVPNDGDEDTRLDYAAARALTPYALSKWIAEDLVLRAAERGLAATIYRPAMIAGHSARGCGNPEDFLQRYLAGCAELGCYLDDEQARCDMTPVDFVASAIAALVVATPRGGGRFHLANVDQSLSFAALGRALVAAGLALEPASPSAFRAAVVARPRSRLHALASFLHAEHAPAMGPWPCARTVAALRALGVVRPAVDAALIARYVAAAALRRD